MCPVLVANGTCAVLHNKKTDLHFKAQENYADETCISTLLSAGRNQSQYFKIHHCALASSILCSICTTWKNIFAFFCHAMTS